MSHENEDIITYLEVALVRPGLSGRAKRVVPDQRVRAVIRALIVVCIDVLLLEPHVASV